MIPGEEQRDSSLSVRNSHNIVVEVRHGSKRRFMLYAIDIRLFCDFLDVETPEEAMARVREAIMENPEEVDGEYMEFVSTLTASEIAELKHDLDLRAKEKVIETLEKIEATQGVFGKLIEEGEESRENEDSNPQVSR